MIMVASRRNPYIIGRPVSEPSAFFDRETLFQFVVDNLEQNAQVLLLHGQRRIGKSSILTQIPVELANLPYSFVVLSLEGKSQKRLSQVLHELAVEIAEDLESPITPPSELHLRKQPDRFADEFLVSIQALMPGKKLVLLFDEFDSLGNFSPEAAATHLFPYLSQVIERHRFLHIIPVIGRRLEDLPTLLGLFRTAPSYEIGLLDRASTYQLVTQPVQGVLHYEESALQAIFEFTAGHPYFTQVLCFAIFSAAREADWWQVTDEDVRQSIDRALELGEGGLAWFWDGLPIAERVFFSAAADVAELKQPASTDFCGSEIKEGEPLSLLEDSGIILTECLHKAQRNLLDWKYLRQTRRVDAPETVVRGSYRVTIELVRRWLVRRHGIKQEMWELEELNPEVRSFYEGAREARQRGDLTNAIRAYETVYTTNPNHLSTLFELAESLLTTEAFSQAMELYGRAYLVDPLRAKDGWIRSLLGAARLLGDRGDFLGAERLLQQALDLDPQSEKAVQTLADIQAKKDQPLRRGLSWGRFMPEWKWNLFGREVGTSDRDKGNPSKSDDR
ncbi:MAG: AAA family ATPase [Alkalinema sp. RU_4_3]|nr:AAA family ATPase [Alkalinema sp. RU_4_3]